MCQHSMGIYTCGNHDVILDDFGDVSIPDNILFGT